MAKQPKSTAPSFKGAVPPKPTQRVDAEKRLTHNPTVKKVPVTPGKEYSTSNLTSQDLTELLNKNIVTFVYIKTNGQSRIALGTRDLNCIPLGKHPKGTGTSNLEKAIPYFDIIKGDWRSFQTGSSLSSASITYKNIRMKAMMYSLNGKKALLSVNELASISRLLSKEEVEANLAEALAEVENQLKS